MSRRLRRPSRKTLMTVVGTFAATVAFLAAVPAAVDAVRSGREWIGDLLDPEEPPTQQQRVVAEFVGEVRRTMPWLGEPTIYEPSVDVMQARLDEFDPRFPHVGKSPRSEFVSPIGDLVDRSPQTAGLVVETWGRVHHRTQVTVLDSRAASWAIQLREPGVRDAIVVCRIPVAAGARAPFSIGDWASVKGLAIADGGVPRADGPGAFRILYLACSHATRMKRPIRP